MEYIHGKIMSRVITSDGVMNGIDEKKNVGKSWRVGTKSNPSQEEGKKIILAHSYQSYQVSRK